MPIKLVIFDLDGTLVDSCRDICNAVNHAIGSFGARPLTVEETMELVGEGVTRLMEKVMQGRTGAGPGDERRPDTAATVLLVEKFLEHYTVHLTDNSQAYPWVRETLQALEGVKKAVISNKREDLSVRLLGELDLLRYFDLVVGSDTTPGRKPSPIPILHALSRLGVPPEAAVIVGDSNFDIEAGRAAGIMTVAAAWGYRPLVCLKDADVVIRSMKELPAILSGNLRVS